MNVDTRLTATNKAATDKALGLLTGQLKNQALGDGNADIKWADTPRPRWRWSRRCGVQKVWQASLAPVPQNPAPQVPATAGFATPAATTG